MARIAGINIPQNKVVSIALTYIHGIGLHSSKKICKKLDISSSKRVNELSEDNNSSHNYIFEPEKNKIISDLIPQTLKTKFFKSILESSASEQGSRMTAMSQATDNAGELLKELKLTYNRSRQAAITKEILEIVGGAEALNN